MVLEINERSYEEYLNSKFIQELVKNFYSDMSVLENILNKKAIKLEEIQMSDEAFKEVVQENSEQISIYFNSKLTKLINEISIYCYDLPYEFLLKNCYELSININKVLNYILPVRDSEMIIYGLNSYNKYIENEELTQFQVNYILKELLNIEPKNYTLIEGTEKILNLDKDNKLNLNEETFIKMEKELNDNIINYGNGVRIFDI